MKKPSSSPFAAIADAGARRVESERIRVSFSYIDWDTPEFFLHGLAPDHYKKIFECLSTVDTSSEKAIVEQTHSSLTPKSIFNNDNSLKDAFPSTILERIAQKLRTDSREMSDEDSKSYAKRIISRAFEVRIGKNYGRLHGFVWDKVFYLVWFDPAHNLYSSKGGVKSPPIDRCITPDCIDSIRAEINAVHAKNLQLTSEVSVLNELLASA